MATSKPDGYTMLAAAQNHAMIPALYSDRVKFDVAKSFAPICIVAKSPTVLVVSPRLGVKTLAEFMQKMREQAGHAHLRVGGHRQRRASRDGEFPQRHRGFR